MKRTDAHLRPLPKAVPPAHESTPSHVHVKASEHTASGHEELVPSATASVKPAASGQPKNPNAVSTKPASSATEAPPVATADGGWVKPAWAIPDDEPRRVREDEARDAGK
jgi:hypothetical protein